MKVNWQYFKDDVKDLTKHFWAVPPLLAIFILCSFENRFNPPWQLFLPMMLALFLGVVIGGILMPIALVVGIIYHLCSIPGATYRWYKDLKAGKVPHYNNDTW